MPKENQGKIIIPAGVNPWPHELHVAKVLAAAGHKVEFIKAGRLPMPDIHLDGIKYEIKSPEHFNANTFEHTLKDALRQSSNIIIDTSRLKKIPDQKVVRFLVG